MSEPLRSPEGEHARRPGTARGLDLDRVADDGAEQRAAERGVGRDAADARDLDLQPVAGLVLDLDERADLDLAARAGPARSWRRGTRSSRRGRRTRGRS